MLYVKESSARLNDLLAQGGGHCAIRRPAMKILLTGGSGFLGSYVAEQLAAAGHTVRALVRPRSDKRLLERLPRVELAPGTIEDRASLDPAVAGVDAVIHVAGIVKARKPADFFEVNAQGTRNLLDAALSRGGLQRFVYVSSLAAVGPSLDGTPVADDAEPRPVTHYGRSKLEAEREVLSAKDRIPVTVVRPPLIYGPRDRETLAFFTSVRNGVLPMTGDGSNTLSVVYASDCATAVVQAASDATPRSGRTYFIDDGAVHVWRDALGQIEQAMGKRAFVRFGMPLGVVKVAAAATQLWGKMSGTAQMLTLDKVNELTQPHWVCSGAGARRELGWTPRVNWAQGVEEAVKWYRAEGWL
jgi:nucleoside-diphosphate-sugar epimerase